VARFEGGIDLVGWEIESSGADQTHLQLRWRARSAMATDYTVFVHLARDNQVIAQDDGFPGDDYLPTTWWQPGDEILDRHVLSAPYDPDRDAIRVGWYEWRSMQHLAVLDERMNPVGTSLELR